MAAPKTRPTDADVDQFLDSVPDAVRRADGREVCRMLARVTDRPAVIWGTAIVGFGQRRLRYASGRELDWMEIGFSPRKASTTIYLTGDMAAYADLLAELGRHTTSGGCLHIKRLQDIDTAVLEQVLVRSVAQARGELVDSHPRPTPRPTA